MWFHSWFDLLRVLAVGAAAYFSLIAVLRVSGKRTLAKLNAFDLVVTVALGSTLATILLNKDVSWAEGVTALALLAGLQLLVAWSTLRLPTGRDLVTARATLLLRDGRPLRDAMAGQRITMDEIRQAVRATGSGDLASIAAVVLETDGSLSVVAAAQAGDRSALQGIAPAGDESSGS